MTEKADIHFKYSEFNLDIELRGYKLVMDKNKQMENQVGMSF